MKVKTEKIPETEGIKNALPKIDFTDTFSTTNHHDSLEKITHSIFKKSPKWIEYLLRLRNVLVKYLGLKTELPDDDGGFKVGGHVGFFEIYSIEQNEIILGADDRHLNFRVSIFDAKTDQYIIKATTLVQYNNRFGGLYMSIVKPFHHFIMRAMVKQAYKI